MEALEQRLAPAMVTWIGPAVGGDWSTAGDWSSGSIPGATDTASIGSGNTVAFSTGHTSRVAALDLDGTLNVGGGNLTIGNSAGSNFTVTTGGSVSGAGSINVADGASNTWSGGTMTGTGAAIFASGSTLTISGSTDVLAGGWTLGGAGAATLTGELNAGSGGGTLNLSALQWSSSGSVDVVGNTLTNAGTITMASQSAILALFANNFFTGGNSANLGGTLINTGTIVHQGAGSLQLFDNTILSNQGTYQFGSDGSILGTTPSSFANAATGVVKKAAGSGTSGINLPFVNQGGTIDAESGTLKWTSGGSSTGGTIIANGTGVVDLTGGQTFAYTGTVTGSGTGRVQLAGGILAIGGGATFNFPAGLLVFAGGRFTGTLTNPSTGFITVSGNLAAGTLNNQGTITQTGGTLTLNGGLSNSGTYDLAPASTGTAITGAGAFTNTSTGLLELTTNITATLLCPFNNQDATVETTAAATTGTLVLGGGGTSTGGSYDASAAGAAIDLAGAATSLFTGTYTGPGAGTIELSLNGAIAAGTAGATLDFTTRPLQISSGGLNVQGNTLTNAGSITMTSPSATIALFANNFFAGGNLSKLGGTLINTGTIVQQGAGPLGVFDNTILSNQGTYQFSADSNILLEDSPLSSFVNAATSVVEKTAGSGTSSITIPFVNQGGTIDAESGTLKWTDGGSSTSATYIANGTGVIDLTGGKSFSYTGAFTGSGTGRVQMASGTLAIGGGGATFNFPAGMLVFAGGTFTGTLTNPGTGFITISGNLAAGTLINQGTITQTGGTLTLSGGLSNSGTYDLAPAATGTVIAGAGAFTNTSTGLLELTTNVTATLLSPFNNQNATVETTAAATTGTLVLGGGGTSTGGSYDASAAGAAIDLAGAATSLFTGTYTGPGAGIIELSLNGAIAAGTGGATLDFTTRPLQISSGGLNVQGNTLTNAGTITMASPSAGLALFANNFFAGGNLSKLGGTLINTGTIVQQGTGSLSIFDNTILSNQGTYQFGSDGNILLADAPLSSFVNAATGLVKKAAGSGTSSIGVPFDNQGGTVDAESGTLTLGGGGTRTDGTYIANSTCVLDLTGGSSPTYTGTVTGSGTGRVQLVSGILESSGAIFDFPSGLLQFSGGKFTGTLTNASTGFISISNVSATGQLDNLGTITQSGGSLNLINSGEYTVGPGTVNLSGGTGGTLTETSSTIGVLSGTFGGLNTLTGSGGSYIITGTLANSGTLALIGSATSPAYLLQGGTINGGTISTSAGATLTATTAGGTLNGVTLAGTLFTGQVLSTFVDIKGGMTIADGGLVTMIGTGALVFLGSQSLTGTGTVDFEDNITAKGLYVANAGDTLTIDSGITIHGISGFVGSTEGGFVTNYGTIAADGGGTITVQGDTNDSGGILTGGTWQVIGNSTLALVGSIITTNAANILLSGSGYRFNREGGLDALVPFAINAADGNLTIENGAIFTPLHGFTNSGTVTIGSGSTLGLEGLGNGYTQTGGVTNLASGTLGVSGAAIDIDGGALSGPGTVLGDLTNASEVDLGSAAGTLTVGGLYTQSATGTLSLKVGGATAGSEYDQVNIAETAIFGGTLDVSLADGFGPSFGQVFPVIHSVLNFNAFATINLPIIDTLVAFKVQTTSSTFNLVGAIDSADLAVAGGSITVNNQGPSGAAGTTGQSITIGYTVHNFSPNAAAGSWIDSIYLSASGALDANAILLGRVTRTSGLAGLSSYNGSLTAALPGVVNGKYELIVVTDSQLQIPDISRTNNTAVSTSPLSITTQPLTLGTPVTATIHNGQDLYFLIHLTSSSDVQVVGNYPVPGEANLFVHHAAIPDTSNYDESVTNPSATSPTINLAQPQGGDYYILVQGQAGAGSGESFTIGAVVSSFAIDSVGPGLGGNVGNATLTVTGADFTSQTAVQLTGPGGTVAASTVDFQDNSTLYATFNLAGLSPGSYHVQAIDHGNQVVTAPGSFQVVAGNPGQLQTNVATYAFIRPNQTGTTVTVYYSNTGDTDIPAPLLRLDATNAVLGYADQSVYVGSSISVLAIDQAGGPAGILPPGYRGSITLIYEPTTQAAHTAIDFSLSLPPASNTVMDWDSFESMEQPGYTTSDAWNAVWGNFKSMAGATTGQFQTLLDNLATYLSEIGETTSDADALYSFAIDLANATLPVAASITEVDASVPTPGLPLSFQTVAQSTVLGRYQMGPLGRGWADNWEISATTDSQGDVTIDDDGAILVFTRLSNGSYLSPTADYDTLTLVGGVYRLLQSDGTSMAFGTDGALSYVQDANGNRITAGYTNGKLTRLTDSNGAFLDLAYNAQGLIGTITDSNGQVTTYQYDPTGQLLTSVTSPEEEIQYGYYSGSNPAERYALTSITKTDGTHVYLGYDSEGRLDNQQGCLCPSNPVEHLMYSYGVGGEVTTSDNSGDTVVRMFDLLGRQAETVDALGRITRSYFDANGNLYRQVLPNGSASTYAYDADGNLVSQTDPLGNTSTYSYDTNNNLTGYTDPDGNHTDYAYNSSNDPLSVTYANGSEEQYTYNPLGEATQFLHADGHVIRYTYNVNGEATEVTFDDGTSYSYDYDKYGNLTDATDAQSNITTFVHGGANDGDPANPSLLSEVIYPDGTFLRFYYNAGGQRTESIDQTGFAVNYTYNDFGRLSELTDVDGNLIAAYNYDIDGRIIQVDNGNGTRTAYTYDAAGNVLSITNYGPDHTTVNTFDDYSYNVNDMVLTDTNRDGQWSYTYDADGQLIEAVFTPNLADPDGLTSQALQYSYDAAGNRISETVNGITTTYKVNDLNQYTSSTTAGQGTTTYQYDANGNLTAMVGPGGATTYSYSELNQLTGMSGPGQSANYAYDPLGNLVSETIDGTTTNYESDPTTGQIFAAFSGTGRYQNTGLLAHYTFGLGLTSQVSSNGTATYYYDFDLSGNTTGMTNAAGNYVNSYNYLPFGQTTTVAAAVSNPFTFGGQAGVLTVAGGLDFMGTRFYSPSIGRFLSPDILGLTGGQYVLYAYVGNNPINHMDPGGTDAVDDYVKCQNQLINSNCSPGGPGSGSGSLTAKCLALQILAAQEITESSPEQLQKIANKLKKEDNKLQQTPCGPGPASPGGVLCLGCSGGGPGGGGAGAHIVTDLDPNDIVGPAGYGPGGDLAATQTMPFRIDFENEASASAPAQVVLVTQQLDTALDWSTFQLSGFNISGVTYAVPLGLTSYRTRLNLTATVGVYVDVSAQFDQSTGILTWLFTSLDPVTFDIPVGDPEEGYLPPNVAPPEGDSWVSYSVDPNANDTTDTAINAQATVYFNFGLSDQSSLATAPIFNTIDAGAPTSSVTALPAYRLSSFDVSWSGSDDPGGSGIASYAVYASDDGGPFTPFLLGTTQTSATFAGIVGHTYGFFSVATDNVGNVQPAPASAQATTTVIDPVTIESIASVSPELRNTPVSGIDVTFSAPIGSTSLTSATLSLTDNGGDNLIIGSVPISLVSGTTYEIGGLSGLTTAEGTYSLTVNGTGIQDPYGNAGSGTISISWLMDTTPPSSTVGALPPQTTSTSFLVSAGGTDASGSNGSMPSGIASLAIFTSTDGGAFSSWMTVTPASPSALFTGQAGHTYGFYSVATDNAGNVEPTPTTAQVTVQILPPLSGSSITAVSPNPRNTAVSSINVSFSVPIITSVLTSADLSLTDDGGPNLINGPVSLTRITSNTYSIGGLSGLTSAEGLYSLTLNAAGLQVQGGNSLSGTLSTSWLIDTTSSTSRVVNALGTSQASDRFPVTVSFSDPNGSGGKPASGVSSVDLYVSVDNGSFTKYQTVTLTTPETSGSVTFTFVGQDRNLYAFHSVAHDAAGNTENKGSTAIEASTSVPDLNPPVTHILASSSYTSTTGVFTLNWAGTDPDQGSGTPAGSIAVVDIYEQIDNGAPTPIAQLNGGTPNSLGVYSGSMTYGALADGASHTYNFFSVGVDDQQKTQYAPASGPTTPDLTFTETYTAPLAVQALTVEKGIADRSYIRYLDVSFNQTVSTSTALQALASGLTGGSPNTYVELLWYGESLNASSQALGGVSLFNTTVKVTFTGNDLSVDFGANGITSLLTGAPANPATSGFGDGWYALGIDPTGNPSNQQVFWEPFFRLLGSATGDETVSGPYTSAGTDAYAVYHAEGQSGALLGADVNGDGAVNSKDLTETVAASGHAVGTTPPANFPQFQLFAGATAMSGNAVAVTPAQVQSLLPEAIAAWQAAGLDAAGVRTLEGVPVQVGNLGTSILGLEAAGAITINRTAAGNNWSVSAATGPAAGEVDLLTVLEHELGHVIGLSDNAQAGDLMDINLGMGVRRSPTSANLPATAVPESGTTPPTHAQAALVDAALESIPGTVGRNGDTPAPGQGAAPRKKDAGHPFSLVSRRGLFASRSPGKTRHLGPPSVSGPRSFETSREDGSA